MNDVIAMDQQWEKFNSSVLLEVTRPNGVFTCTGVAISPTLILTAAHCIDGEVTQIKVFNTITYDPEASFFEVRTSEIHPDYNKKISAYQNDIAKIHLKRKLPSSINFHPIYMKDEVTGDFIRFGFGERNKTNNRTVVTPKFRFVNHLHKVIELDDHFSISGDSGGPIFLLQKNKIYLLAIHSTFSKGPQGEFSFNPLVSKYLDWINSRTRRKTHAQVHP